MAPSSEHNPHDDDTLIPRVTVCVPVRNGSRTIRRTLESILTQDYPNMEVIVSDNCSTDDTAQVLQEYAARGVEYFSNPRLELSGESNWNYVLSIARGPLIALYHADDLYTPTMVRRQVEFLQAHREASAVFTMTRMIDDHDRPIRMGDSRLPVALQGQECFGFSALLNDALRYGTITVVPTMMARREALDAVGCFRWERFASASDIDLYLRLAQWGPIGIIDEPLHRYRISSGQGSAQIHRRRTSLAHFYLVLDYYLQKPDVRAMVEPEALAHYELRRATDQVRCSVNLLAQDKAVEARPLLDAALQARYFVTALKRPWRLAALLFGACLRISIIGGHGQWLARVVLSAYERVLQRRAEPVEW